MFSFCGELLDFLLLFDLLESLGLLNFHQLLIRIRKIGSHLSDFLLTGDFTLFLALEILFGLTLDQFALEHLFLKLLDEV